MAHPLLAALLIVGLPALIVVAALGRQELRWRLSRWRKRDWWRP